MTPFMWILSMFASTALSVRPIISWYGQETHSFPDDGNEIQFGSSTGHQPLHIVSDGPRLIALGAWLPSQEPDLWSDADNARNYEKITKPIARAWVSDNGGNVWMWHPVPLSAVRLGGAVGMITTPFVGRMLCVIGGKVCFRQDDTMPCRWNPTRTAQCSANNGLTWRAMPPLNSAIVSGSLVQGPAGIFIVGGWLWNAPTAEAMDGDNSIETQPESAMSVRRAQGLAPIGGGGTMASSGDGNGTTPASTAWGDPMGGVWSGVVRMNWPDYNSGVASGWSSIVAITPMDARLYPAVTWSDKCDAMFLTAGTPHYASNPDVDGGVLQGAVPPENIVWRIDRADFANRSAWTAVGDRPRAVSYSQGQLPDSVMFEVMAVDSVGWIPYDKSFDGAPIPVKQGVKKQLPPRVLPLLGLVTNGQLFAASGYGRLPSPELPSAVGFVSLFPTLFPFDQEEQSQVYARATAVYLAQRGVPDDQLLGIDNIVAIAGTGLRVPGGHTRANFTGAVLTGYPFVGCRDPCPGADEMDGALFFSTGCRHSPYDAVCFPCDYYGYEQFQCKAGVTMIARECGVERDMMGHLQPLKCEACAACPQFWVMTKPCSGRNNTVCVPHAGQGWTPMPPDGPPAPSTIIPTGESTARFLLTVAAIHGAGLLAFLVSKALSSKTSRRYVSGLCAHRVLCPSGIQLPPAPSKATRGAVLYAASCCTDSACRAYALTLASVLINAPQNQGAGVLSAALLIAPLSTWVLNTGFVWLRGRVAVSFDSNDTATATADSIARPGDRPSSTYCWGLEAGAWPGKVYRAWVLWLECLSPRTALIGVLARQRAQMLAVRTRPLPDPAGELQHHSEPVVSSHSDATPDFGVHAKPAEGHGFDEAYVGPMSSWAAVSILSSDIPCLVSALALVHMTCTSFYGKTHSSEEIATQITCLLAAAASVQFFVSIIFTLLLIGLSRGRISLLKHHPAGLFGRHGTGELAMGQASSNPLAVASRVEVVDIVTGSDRPHVATGGQASGLATSRSVRAALAAGDRPGTRVTEVHQMQIDRRQSMGTQDSYVLCSMPGHGSSEPRDSRATLPLTMPGLADPFQAGSQSKSGVRVHMNPMALLQASQDAAPVSAAYGCWSVPIVAGPPVVHAEVAPIPQTQAHQPTTFAATVLAGHAADTTEASHGRPLWASFRPVSESSRSRAPQADHRAGSPLSTRTEGSHDTPRVTVPAVFPDAQACSAESEPADLPSGVRGPVSGGGYRDLELERDMGITCPPMSPSRSIIHTT